MCLFRAMMRGSHSSGLTARFYRPCVIAVPPPRTPSCVSVKSTTPFWWFRRCDFLYKNPQTQAKNYKSFEFLSQIHQYICPLFLGINWPKIDVKILLGGSAGSPNHHAILSEHFHDDFYVNQKGTTPIQDFWKMASRGGELLHKDGKKTTVKSSMKQSQI